MRKIFTFLIAIIFIGSSATGQVHLNEDFQRATTNDPWIPATWTVIDNDQNPISANAGLNASITSEWLGGFGTQNGLGASVINSSAYDPAGSSSDDWLITPQISLPAAVAGKTSVLTFLDGYFAANSAPYNTASTTEVRVSTTGNATSDFTDVVSTTSTTIGTNFFLQAVDLSAYAGQDIYIAFRDISTDTWIYYIDNVNVETKDDDAIAINTVQVVDLAENGADVTISGSIVNTGVNNITSYEVSWEDGSGGTNIYNVTGVNIPPLFTGAFEHTTPLVASNPGNYTDIDITVSNPNGSADGDLSDNSETAQVFVNNGDGIPRTVLVEEHSDAGCQFCPDGAVGVKQLKVEHPEAIVVQHHGGYQFDDGMTIDGVIEEYEKFPMGGLPAIIFDRANVNPATNDRSVGWPAGAGQAEERDAYVELSIGGGTLEAIGSRTLINLDIDIDFKDYVAPGDIRLTVYLVEDTLVNDPRPGQYDADWDQVNWYNPNGPADHPYRNVGTPIQGVSYIDGYEHLDVVRDVWPSADAAGAWGSDAVITKTNPAPGDQFSGSADFLADTDMDLNQLTVVAFLSYYDAANEIGGRVLNATKATVTDFWYVGVDENASSVAKLDVFPNPSSTITNLNLTLVKSDDVELRVFDITGKELRYEDLGTVNAGTRNIELNVSDLANGFYFVNLTVGDETITKKISVNK